MQFVVDYGRMRGDSAVVEHGMCCDLVILDDRLSCYLTSTDIRLSRDLVICH